MIPVEAAAIRDEIRQLAYQYADAIDRRDIDRLVALYVDDVRVGDQGGPAALRSFWTESLSHIGASYLFVGNHLIDIDSPTDAHGSVYCLAHVDEGDRFVRQAIRYDDTYRLVSRAGVHQWRFVHRKHRLFWGEALDRNPFGQAEANWPQAQVGRGTLPFTDPVWQAFWHDRDYPGV